MKRSELKRLIKPLVKECIKEELLASGLISGVIAEVMKGFQGSILKEATKPELSKPRGLAPTRNDPQVERNTRLEQHREQLLESIGRDSFNGVNVFEGVTTSIPEPLGPSAASSPLANQDPSDPGVDISGIVAMGGSAWSQLIK